MSTAFIKEGESGQLKYVAPCLGALLYFLRVENSDTATMDERNYFSERYGREVYQMSDGLIYALDETGHWFIILD